MALNYPRSAGLGAYLGAAIVGAAILGFVCGIIFLFWAGATQGVGQGADLVGGFLYVSLQFVVFSIVLGTLPGALVLGLTRARFQPWRSLPRLLTGAALGFLGVLLIMPGSTGSPAAVFFGPTIGGLLASLTIPKT